jgi:hypothetical protein
LDIVDNVFRFVKTINTMINYFKRIFVNDWITVKTFTAHWIQFESIDVNGHRTRIQGSECDMQTYYTIHYSPIRNCFKLTTTGKHNNSTLKTYLIAVNLFNKLNIELLSGKSFNDVVHLLNEN